MKESKLTINQGFYFPVTFRIFGGLLPFFSIFFIVNTNYIMAALAVAMAYLLLTTRYEISFDFLSKHYKEQLRIFGFKRGESKPFKHIDRAIITESSKTKTYNSRGSSSTIRYTSHHLFLVVDGEKIELLESEKEKKIKKLHAQLKSHIGEVPTVNA
ncbi:hypothetical protein E1176_14860 [Fulvivirga sp. RKSG066]|uniref:hypothetical protein n=1 Tax=Fulvivirga aurantia TaxID=2529383 RepID=UPI0012BC5410|nr:hypothetical protein [Fulvivirga aurantia]MTI22310.1 hypothetical protein [Fulvivirga aurantia]